MIHRILRLRSHRLVLLAAVLYLFVPTGLRAQASVTAILKDPSGAPATGQNTYVRFTLEGYGSNIPRVVGTNIIVPPFKDFKPDANGNISGSIQGNDTISVGANPAGGTWYRVCEYRLGQLFRCNNFTITGGAFDLDSATPNTTNPTIPAPTGDTTYARIDGGNQPFSGSITAPNITATNQLKSTVATGTPPLIVASTTVVANLNASQLDGKSAPSGNIVGDTDVQTLTQKTVDTATPTELAYVHGVTSTIQTQLDAKVPTSRTVNGHALSSNVTVSFPDTSPTAAAVVGLFDSGSCSGYLYSDGTCSTPSNSNSGRNTSVCSTAAAGGSTCATVVNLDHAETDTNYAAAIGCVGPTQFPIILGYTKTTTSVTVTISNGTNNMAQISTCSELDVVVLR
jgi:hypothetical protein